MDDTARYIKTLTESTKQELGGETHRMVGELERMRRDVADLDKRKAEARDLLDFRQKLGAAIEAKVDLSVDVGNAGDDVMLKAVVDIDDPYVIVTDWGKPVISSSGEIKINATAERVVFVQEPTGDPMEHVYPMHVAPNGSMKDMWLSKNERT